MGTVHHLPVLTAVRTQPLPYPEAFSFLHFSVYCLLPTQYLFHLQTHSRDNLDTFYSPHTLKKKKKLPTGFLPGTSFLTHAVNSLTHHFLQISHSAFVLIHCFSPLFNTASLFCSHLSFVHLATCFSLSFLFYFLFFINLS